MGLKTESPSTPPEAAKPRLDQLYVRYRLRLLAVIRRYVHSADESEDVLQDVFIRVNRGLSGFREESSLYTWLHRIAVNTSLSYLRKHHRRLTQWEPFEHDISHLDSPEEIALANECSERFQESFKTLTDDQQIVFGLRFRDDMSYLSIAEITNVPVGTVRSRLNRVKTIMQQGLL